MKVKPTPTRPRLGPNDRQDCPSDGCRVWHAAHGIWHTCGKDEPVRQRADGVTPRRAA
ncbi:hypothetical protein [Polymorphospora lycopeni]|uniref:Uncharacterized protein n=1 Tax=Polymorphospora lycopeni TaxID=3140240 RepID=A0ABV5CKR8_9ACTN